MHPTKSRSGPGFTLCRGISQHCRRQRRNHHRPRPRDGCCPTPAPAALCTTCQQLHQQQRTAATATASLLAPLFPCTRFCVQSQRAPACCVPALTPPTLRVPPIGYMPENFGPAPKRGYSSLQAHSVYLSSIMPWTLHVSQTGSSQI